MLLIESSDATHAEAVSHGQFAGVDDVALVFKTVIKRVEIKFRIGRHMESDNDGGLQRIGQQGFESHLTHTGHQQITVGTVATAPAVDATLGFILGKRLVESE